ncbi:MAG: symmetrical bis(5'-nucleosyl)-tetraphosphatase [Zoogloeaceae bacterium]|jgi:bis(5'-nucleosyl)-tetraphosphatase (symmetrical)|nr:symmetrical bis(5'-nucleosyl)-tetraphosphatase [Zoogloeaceae bacterium]
MSIYAVGDVQGCFDALRRLLDLCAFDPARDTVWFTGDLVNRGPQSLETLRFVKSLGPAAVTVLGNHDLYLLMVAEGRFPKRGKDDTLQDVLDAPDAPILLEWLRARSLCHVQGGYCLVHAGLLPQWTVSRARALAAEVEAELQGPRYRLFFGELWGSKPAGWSDDLRGVDRLRVIVNAMTRMRFCTRKGKMDFVAKGKLEDAPGDCLPWFAVPGRKSADHVLVAGHWSALGLQMTPNLLALDSGYLWGGQLTAVRLEDRRVFQIDCAPGEGLPAS